jgi:HK97 family phage portal protein
MNISASWTKPSYEVLAKKALRNPYSSRGIAMIADAAASIANTLIVRRPDGEGGFETVEDHPINVLLAKPNDQESTPDFFKKLIYDLFLGGEVIIRMKGPTTRFNPLSFQRFAPNQLIQMDVDDDTGKIERFWIRNLVGKQNEYEANEIIFVANYDPLDNWGRGRPLVMSILQALDLFDESMEWGKSISEHKGRIPGFFVAGGKLGDNQHSRLKREMQEAYIRDSGQALPGLLEDGMKFEKNSIDPNEADWAKGLINYMRMIAAGIGVDPALLGDGANKTYSNFKEAYRALFQLTVLPLIDWLLSQMTCRLMPLYETPDHFLTYDESAISAIQEDLSAQAERLTKLVAGTIITPDEARLDLSKDARGGQADKLLTKTGTLALEDTAFSLPVPNASTDGDDPEADAITDDEALAELSLQIDNLLKHANNGIN